MNDNRQPFIPTSTRPISKKKLDPEKTAAILLAILLCLTVISVLGGIETGIMAYQGVVVTAIAWLTYRYSKSAECIARASLNLAPPAPKQELLSTPVQGPENKKLLNEILEELRKAEARRRPPFELSAWQRHEGRIRSRKMLREGEIAEAASCYAHLAKENEEISCWQELESRLAGLVDAEKRRTVSLTLNAMENENLAVVRKVTLILENYLRQPGAAGNHLREATTRRESAHKAQSSLAMSSFGRWG